ncbi:UDP-4-amino-4,6-dideoxy-N-acetyl-beta-L-altrosamine N-acetyltransferase [Francisella sciaenopsi]|uniref:UDP-4-amino-4, 6-dideoxy-N-acetyl-beta-L-altrosami ne N-acetyltransferase n=1 Tax=Francisella sciaenopsi TaxID=3055034 RepID=A0ABQ6PI51_9GAMM
MIELRNFIDLDKTEKQMVLNWRNSERVRASMYNSQKIYLQDHLNFIEELMYDKYKKYFLVKNRNVNIGVVYLDNIKNDEAIMGIYSNPELRGQGTLLLNALLDYSFMSLNLQRIKLEVYADNCRARSLYGKYGFIENGVKFVNRKEVICMELENENW